MSQANKPVEALVPYEPELEQHNNGVKFSDVEREERMRLFLETYVTSMGNVSESCEAAKIDRQSYWYWTKNYPSFVSALEEAKDKAKDHLRMIVLERGVIDRNPSDRILIKMMEAHLPEYRYPKQVEVSVEPAQAELDTILKQYVLIEKVYLTEEDMAQLIELAWRIDERKCLASVEINQEAS